MERHARQARLVGSVGQERIGHAAVGVRLEGLAGEVAVRYLAGAGVGRLRVRTPDLAATARAVDPNVEVEVEVEVGGDPLDGREDGTLSGIEDPIASEVALGALIALRALRVAIADLSPMASCSATAGKPGAS
jgi:hypothetical protein